MTPVRAYLGLGANLGDRLASLRAACAAIGSLPDTRCSACSSVYRTEPVGFKNQPEFLNCAVEIETALAPEALIAAAQAIEQKLGRVHRRRWHEREIDIDLLLYGDLIVENERFSVPHPRLHERKFALVPLAEISHYAAHPLLGKTFRQMVEQLSSSDMVERVYDAAVLRAR